VLRETRRHLRKLLAHEVGIALDVHDRREAESSLVQRLAEVGTQHAGEDASVDGPKEFLIGCLIDVCGLIANNRSDLCTNTIQSACARRIKRIGRVYFAVTDLVVLVCPLQGEGRCGLGPCDRVVIVAMSWLFHFACCDSA
jgi:hypothetical protein